jgi:drug/metabolite transporter (DMT)-like permease
MAWTGYQVFLALLLVTCGSINTISTKWTDKIKSFGKDDTTPREFNHPFVQACIMFMGEFLCVVVFKILFCRLQRKNDGSEDQHTLTKGNRNFSQFILMPPAMCDLIATSTMYVGLTLTYASSFQMLRGSVIIFVALFSKIFLGRQLGSRRWIGILFIATGLAVVGVSDMLSNDNKGDTTKILIGDCLIVLAQIITATQMTYEEKYVGSLNIPSLQAVGWEGIFGFIVLSILLVPMYFIHVPAVFSNNPRNVVEDAIDAFYMIKHNYMLLVPITGTIFSIAFFNFAGISVTKEISATTRMVLDSIRTIVIWSVSLAIGWQNFHPLQLLGFASLLFGMCIYNDIIVMRPLRAIGRCLCCRASEDDEMRQPIVNQQADQA